MTHLLRKAGIALLAAAACTAARAAETDMESAYASQDVVYVIPINDAFVELGGMVDPWLAAFVGRKVQEARRLKPRAIILEISTHGGLGYAMERIGQGLDEAGDIPTVAYIKTKASSAGAYIALSCRKIYMKRGSRIGSAMGILVGKDGKILELDDKTREKMLSDGRAAFRARAEKYGHSKALAESMVDSDIEVVQVRVGDELRCIDRREFDRMAAGAPLGTVPPELVDTAVARGELANFTAEEAEKWGLSAGTVDDFENLLGRMGLSGAKVVSAEAQPLENTARLLQSQVVAGLLMSVGSLAILLALYSGSGTAALVGLFCFGMFFWAQRMGGTASSLDIALFLIGFAMLAVEVFLIPGFGFFGLAGIGFIFASLVLSMLQPNFFGFGDAPDLMAPFRWSYFTNQMGVVVLSVLVSVVAMAALARYVRYVPLFGRLVMQAQVATVLPDQVEEEAYAQERPAGGPAGVAVGDTGTAKTDLGPGGKVVFGDRVLMVVADSEFIDAGAQVKVSEVKGRTIVVVRA